MMLSGRRRMAAIACGVAVWVAAAGAPARADTAPWPAAECAEAAITEAAVDPQTDQIVVFGSATLCPEEKHGGDLRFAVVTFPPGAGRVLWQESDLREYAPEGPRPFGVATNSSFADYGVCVMASIDHRVACVKVVVQGFRLAVQPIKVDDPLVSAAVEPVPEPERGTGGECGSCY